MLKKWCLIFFLFALIGISCDAPKNNPLHSGAGTTPLVSEFNTYSIVENRFTLPKLYQFKVEAKIFDPNELVESVYVYIPYFKVKKKLSFNSSNSIYEKTLTVLDLNTTKADEVIGQEFNLQIKDKSSKTYTSRTESIKRIIKEEIVIDSPLGYDTTETSPLLAWREFEGGFSHHYYVQVFIIHEELYPELIWEKDDIPADSLSVKVDAELPSGKYYWIIWCVDQFKNRARSKEAKFTIL